MQWVTISAYIVNLSRLSETCVYKVIMKNHRKRLRLLSRPLNEIIIIPLLAWVGWLAIFIPMLIYICTQGWNAHMPGKGGGWTMAQGFWPVMVLALFPLIFTWAFTRQPPAKDYHAVWSKNIEAIKESNYSQPPS